MLSNTTREKHKAIAALITHGAAEAALICRTHLTLQSGNSTSRR